jgi:thiol-disulfide isomerase/thioredoxin
VSKLGVLRNIALAVAFAALPSLDSVSIGTHAWMWIAIGVALATSAGLTVAVLALAREVGMLRLQLGTQGALEIAGEGPEIGARAVSLADRMGRDGADFGLAVFTSEGCGICQTLAPAIDNVAKDPRVAVGVFDEVAEAELWRTLGIPGSPFALALDPDGTVLAKGTFNNLAQLESVLATAERRGEPVGA